MASTDTDRRARGVRRVDFSKLVEICGRSGETPAFEARGIELSGRGMQVRTKYLPEQGAALVLRFEHDGEEAVIEGEVAWRRENDKGGEFGIKFTALDSNSVKVLKTVCDPALAKLKAVAPAAHPEAAPEPREPGTAVRLHIHGLGAPMKARVFESKGRKLHVGSQLEFLKVGRTLELEDVDGGDTRPAEIDSVTVSIDPRTQIPQLIVSLRYDDDETPEPSVVGADDAPRAASRKRDAVATRSFAERDEADGEPPEDDEDEDDEDESMFKGRVAALASRAGAAVQEGGRGVAALGARATQGIFSLFRSGQRRGSGAKERVQRRTTAARASIPVAQRASSLHGQKDRPRAQRSQRARTTSERAPSSKRRMVVAAAALAICASSAYPLFLARDERRAPVAAAPLPEAAAPPAVPAPVAAPPGSVLPTGAFPVATALDVQAQLAAAAAPVTVDVPLFGTQQLSTLEAAPLTPPPETAIDEVGMAKDQTFAQPVVPSLSKAAPAEAAESEPQAAEAPSGKTVWQAGKMHLPVIHRLRLDGPGTDLQGTDTPNGFSVLIPGRKVMETGAQIAKRDDRILSVNVKNTPAGGQVVFRFRKDVPGHKVRLRNDYVEFFVNSETR